MAGGFYERAVAVKRRFDIFTEQRDQGSFFYPSIALGVPKWVLSKTAGSCPI
jgi:hypothetical protein